MPEVLGEANTQLSLLATKPDGSNWNLTLPFVQSPELDFDAENQPSDMVQGLPLNAATIRYDHPESEYLITLKNFNGAPVSEMAALQGDGTRKPMTGWVIGGAVLVMVGIGTAFGVRWWRRMRAITSARLAGDGYRYS